jgi:hypothetical protein
MHRWFSTCTNLALDWNDSNAGFMEYMNYYNDTHSSSNFTLKFWTNLDESLTI